MENIPFQDETWQQVERSTALTAAQRCGVCQCIKTSSKTGNAGTQTEPMTETHDASTQCDIVTRATGYSLYLAPVDVSVQHPATGRQTDTAAALNTPSVLTGKSKSGGKYTPWNKKSKDESTPGISFINKFNNSYGKMVPKRHMTPLLDGLSMTDGTGRTCKWNLIYESTTLTVFLLSRF